MTAPNSIKSVFKNNEFKLNCREVRGKIRLVQQKCFWDEDAGMRNNRKVKYGTDVKRLVTRKDGTDSKMKEDKNKCKLKDKV